MLRLLGLLPPLEPTPLELAEARILEQTGYTSETIAGFQQAVRDRDAQLVALEERLTTRILLLQKERDEALLGVGVGLTKGTPLPPGDKEAIEQAAHGLAQEQAQQYEQTIAALTAQIQEMQQQQQQQQQQAPVECAAAASEAEAAQPPSQAASPSQHASDAVARDLSSSLKSSRAEVSLLHQALEVERSERQALERHLADLQLHTEHADSTQRADGQGAANYGEHDLQHHSQPPYDESVQAELQALRLAGDEALENLHACEERVRAEISHREQAEAYIRQLQEEMHHFQAQAQQTMGASADAAAVAHLQQQLHAQQAYSTQLQQALGDAQSQSHAKDAELQRLQSELLRVHSVDHSPPPSATPTDVAALQQQVQQLQQSLSEQTARALDEKRRTQATLTEKLTQVKTVIASKDDIIKKLKAQISQQKQQQTPQTQQQQAYNTPAAFDTALEHVPQ